MSEDRYVNEAGTLRCKKQLKERGDSTSNHVVGEKPSKNLCEEDASWRRKTEIKWLEGRLRVLEEEVQMLKGALLKGVEERTKMMNEIHEDFKTIQHCLLQREIERGKSYARELPIVSLSKDKKAGLLHVLCQESNPSLVNRGLRANALGYDST
ncbi:hypothetical protein CDL12_12929 [Handroanthus impetiginosus]|uniref:Uncharacterized protein n=1 Tax=Handroanthus impetiginosus TaxID=429701 RepID=A0A2G9HAB5_9LAMI|nr:hypothetical protein CDL12_13014 [Handroanthus impetiginosus]PIN14449.1 hypothetical protein CDL12_12929 [Handroanthus impetiginosus]